MKKEMKKWAGQPKPYQYKACGLDNVYLVGGVKWKDTPRGKAVHINDIEGLHRAIGQWLMYEKKTLTGKEFRFLRHEINLTQQNLASLLGTDIQNVGRWEREEVKIPGPAQAVVRLLYNESINENKAVKEPLARLAELDEKMGEGEEINFTDGPDGWSTAA
jgi:putative transcriptional regulator